MIKLTSKSLEGKVDWKKASQKEISDLFDLIKQDQGKEFVADLTLCGIANYEMLRGWLLCYFSIREALKKKEVEELENIFNDGERSYKPDASPKS